MSDTVKSLGTILSAAPGAAASLVVPDPKTHIPLTGAGAQAFSFANMISNLLTSNQAGINPNPLVAGMDYDMGGYKTNGVDLPGNTAVEAASERVKKEGDRLLPPTKPETAGERIGQEAVRGAVSMGLPIPGFAKLPTALQSVGHLLAPAVAGGKTAAVVGGLGATVGAAAGAGKELDDAEANPLLNAPLDDKPSPIPQIASLQQPATAQPAMPLSPAQALLSAPFDDKPTDLSGHDALVHQGEDSHLSWGQLLSYAAAGAGVVVAHKFLSGAMKAKVDAATEARYNDQQAVFDADTAGRASGVIGSGTPMPDAQMPPRQASPIVPESLQQASLKARTKTVDKNAGLASASDFYAKGAADPNLAENLRAQYGTLLNEGSVASRTLHVMETGHDATSGVSMAPLADHFQRLTGWDDATRQLYLDARNAANELDNRAIRARDYNATAGTDETRVNFRGQDDATLQQQVAAGWANPDVAYELHNMQSHYARMTELMEKSGLVSTADAARFRTDHPNYLSSYDTSGTISNPFKARDYTNAAGHDAAITPVWELDAQHFQSVLKLRDQNIAISNFIENGLDYQARNPKAFKMFTPRTDANGAPVIGDNTITYRVGGQLKYIDVASSELKHMLDMPVTAQSAIVRAAAKLSALSRSGTTQTLATIGGAPFSALNALRTNTRIMIAARPEMYTGQLDKLAGTLTGDRVRLRGGLDPTSYLNPVIGTARNVYGGLADARVAFLRGGPEGPGGWARKVLQDYYGQAGYDALIQRAELVAERSTRAQMAANGALDAAGMSAREITTSRFADKKDSYSIANAVAPELFADKGMLGQTGAKIVRLNNLMQEVASWVGESAQTQHFALNRGNKNLAAKFGKAADTALTYNVRQSAGDVGQRGSSELMRNYASVSKYANVAIQDWANITDAFARAPFHAMMNLITTMGLPALASIYTAMLHGPDAINYLFNELTDDQRGARIPFFIPGNTPENSPTIPFSQNERWIIAPMLQLFADLFNLQAHGTGDSTYEWAKQGLEDLFSKHITTSTGNSALRGLASGTEIIVPDVAQVGAAVVGRRLKIDPVDILTGGDKPLSERLTVPASANDPRMPNVASDNDANAGAVTHKMFWDVVSAVFGAVGTGIHQDSVMAGQRYALTHDPVEAAAAFAQSYGDRASNSAQFARGTLFNAPMKLALGTPLSNSVHEAVEKFRPLLTAKSDMRYEGMTRKGGMELPPPPGSQPKMPTDPTMFQLYMVASKIGEKLISAQRAPMKEVQDWDKQIAALPRSGLKPEEIRERSNTYVRARNVALQRAAEFINDGNKMLSQIAGKPVDIRKIDFHKGPEQFMHQRP